MKEFNSVIFTPFNPGNNISIGVNIGDSPNMTPKQKKTISSKIVQNIDESLFESFVWSLFSTNSITKYLH